MPETCKHFPAEVSDVGSKQGEHGLHRRIVQTLLHLRRQPASGETDPDATRGDEKKLQARLPQRKGPGQHGRNRETERDEGSGVVHQALAFENDHDLAGHLQILSHGQRRHGIRWRNEGAKDETDRQRQPRQGMKQAGDCSHRQEDQKGGQGKNRPQVGAEISPGSVNGRGVKQRRKKQDQRPASARGESPAGRARGRDRHRRRSAEWDRER